MEAKYPIPSKELLVQVRAAFVLRGTSFNAWCKANSVVRRTAEQSLIGHIRSDRAQQLLQRIVRDVNLSDCG